MGPKGGEKNSKHFANYTIEGTVILEIFLGSSYDPYVVLVCMTFANGFGTEQNEREGNAILMIFEFTVVNWRHEWGVKGVSR